MTTKTKHRIPADKIVIEDDRRKAQYDEADKALPDNVESDRRRVEYNYSQPHKIIYVPVEPQPYSADWSDHFQRLCIQNKKNSFPTGKDSPFHPDDTLILLEEWVEMVNPVGNYLQRVWSKHLLSEKAKLIKMGLMPERNSKEPASTMPPSLDSKCQQYHVVKVLGVEEKMMSPDPLADGMWHWILLTEETK